MKTETSTDPRRIHAHVIKTTPSGAAYLAVHNKLITLYSKFNLLSDAHRLFQDIQSPNFVSWTALISGHSNSPAAFRHFIAMLRHPTLPNQRTLASLLKTCASLTCFSFGLQLHSYSIKRHLSSAPFTASALINLYSKANLPYDAQKVFDEIPKKDGVCFSSIIVALAQNSKSNDALNYFADMKACGFGSNEYSVSAALRAAAELSALEQCRMVHGHAVVIGLDTDMIVGTALVDGYGKCGLVNEASGVFDELMPNLNLIGWNAMLSGYAQQGDKDSAAELFEMMVYQGLVPDHVSFLAIMMAFCNAGLAEETERWFRKMVTEYKMEPRIEHYTCLVGVMGRVGRLEEAKKIALTMPNYKPDAAMWRALLSASSRHGDVEMVKEMSQKLLEVDPQDDSAYVIAANAFAGAGKMDEVQVVRKLMRDRRVKKEGGWSWIEVHGQVHVFWAGGHKHEKTEAIYAKLAEVMDKIEKLGYVPVLDELLHGVEELEKKGQLRYHSEKLALAFGLVSGAPPGKPLRVVKNLRICRDCHEAFKYISRLVKRDIIVRDVNRYHRFSNGSCNCGDNW